MLPRDSQPYELEQSQIIRDAWYVCCFIRHPSALDRELFIDVDDHSIAVAGRYAIPLLVALEWVIEWLSQFEDV